MGTMQFERAAEEGSLYIRPSALYELGRTDEAFELAHDQAVSGYPETLFYLLNRAGRSDDVVSYLEERWPSIATFAAENHGDEYGYAMMAEVALAYTRTGNQVRFDEAMSYIEQHTSKLIEQGVDNFLFSGNRAVQFALLGDYDAAFTYLRKAVDSGWASGGKPEEVAPALEVLADDPRFFEIEAAMLATTNRDREIVGLPPMDLDYKVAALTVP
jgi:tetratricopeptide (TPR) repeat protein